METEILPDVAIPPGETLSETLEALQMSQAELARRMDRPPQVVSEIVNGTKQIMPDTAIELERVLGVPARFWLRLEADYRCVRARLEDRERLEKEAPFAAKYPYLAMSKMGWVPPARAPLDRTESLLRFFGVASLAKIPHPLEAPLFRRSARVGLSLEALQAWLRQGERAAAAIETAPFDANALRAALQEIRAMTMQPARVFRVRLRTLLGSLGVAWAVVPHLPGTGAHGATRWMGPQKALMQISLRYRWADVFWHTLVHEIAHLLLHPRGEIFIEFDKDGHSEREAEANRFATDTLVPADAYAAFCAATPRMSAAAVESFAARIGIAPGVVVGRLQHDGRLPHHQLNRLRKKFVFGPPPTSAASGAD